MLLLLATLAVAQDTCPEGWGFPAADWPQERVSSQAAAALEAHLYPPGLDRSDKERAGTRTDGFVVIHQGKLVHESYGGGYDAQQRHLAWSVTKSFTNALTGIAVREGKITLDDSICDHLQGLPEASCAVHIQDVLEFATGFDWLETYEGFSPTASSVLAMLYGEGRADKAAFVAGHALRDPPGSSYMYSSGDTNVLAKVVGAALQPDHGEHFPWKLLFEPIGMKSAVWERDAAGTYVGSSYLYATPRDLARFGYLLLNDGCWEQERILPPGWVEASTRVSEAYRTKALGTSPGDVQGRQFWLNQPVPEQGQPEPKWPSVPTNAYAALGHWKQSIVVIPDLDLVVVRTGDDRDGSYDHDTTLRLAMALVQEAP